MTSAEEPTTNGPHPIGEGSDTAHGSDPLVGRASQRRELEALLDRLNAGHGSWLALRGEAGIGKSRLLADVREDAKRRGIRVIAGAGVPGTAAPPDWIWMQIARGLPDLSDARAQRAEQAERAERGEGVDAARLAASPLVSGTAGRPTEAPDIPGLERSGERFRMFDGLWRLVASVASEAPVLLLLDDLHEVHAQALEPLRLLLPLIESRPIAVVAAYRSAASDLDEAQRKLLDQTGRKGRLLDIAGLARVEVENLLRGLGHRPDLAAALHARTGGNPLFVRELARWLETPEPAPWPAGETRPLPDTVRATLEQRLHPLGEDARSWLEVACVLGPEIAKEGWLRAGARDRNLRLEEARGSWLDASGELAAARLLEPEDPTGTRFRLCHDLLREVVEAGLGPRRRAEVHAAVALALEELDDAREDSAAALAHHFALAMPLLGAKPAVEYARRAGTRAADLGLYELAARHYREALDWLARGESPSNREEVRLLIDLAGAQRRSGAANECVETLRRAVAPALGSGDGESVARAALAYPTPPTSVGLGGTLFDPLVKSWLEQALELLPERDHPLRARAMARVSGSRTDRLSLTVPALEMARRLGDPLALADVLAQHIWALEGPARLEARIATAREVAELAGRMGDLALATTATILEIPNQLERGDRDALNRLHQRLGQQNRELGEPYHHWLHATAGAMMALLDGDLPGSEAAAHHALELAKQGQCQDGPRAFGGQLLAVRIEQDRAEEMLAGALRLKQATAGVALFEISHGRLMAEAGKTGQAREILYRFCDPERGGLPEDLSRIPCAATLAEIAIAVGDSDAAPGLYEVLLPHAGRHVPMGGAVYLGPASRLLGGLAARCGALEDAREHLEAAVEECRQLGALPWIVRSRAELAGVLHRRNGPGDRQAASELLETAGALARERDLPRALRLVQEIAAQRPADGRTCRRDSVRTEPTFRVEGEVWHLCFEGESAHLTDVKGLHYLRFLLAHPDTEVHCLELVALAEPLSDSGPQVAADTSKSADGAPQSEALARDAAHRVDSGSAVLDATAIAQYRSRIASLQAEISQAEQQGDHGGLERARSELSFLETELGRALGLGGRSRRLGDPNERARKAVGNRLRAAFERIERFHPKLAAHLRASVRTGSALAYRPARPVAWRTA